MKAYQRCVWTMLTVAAVAVMVVGCGDASSSEDGAEQAAETTSASGESGGYTVDIDEIFPEGEGKDLVLNNCQNCHSWVPIVVLQMNEQQWDRWAQEHRQRVAGLSDEEFETLHAYLKENFNPDQPVPELPPALLETWTTY